MFMQNNAKNKEKCCNSNRGSVPETVFPRTREDGFFEIKKNALIFT